jgi:hypothetical protein
MWKCEMVFMKGRYDLIRNKKGQTTVEFALIGILLFGLVFAVIDFGTMLYVNLTMQHAVREGARYAITGPNPLAGDPRDRRTLVIDKIHDSSVGLCDKNPCTISFVNLPNDPNVGAPSELITIRVAYSWPLLTPIVKPFFPDGKYSFTVGATMRNEPFEG